jgi:hypothetical protein
VVLSLFNILLRRGLLRDLDEGFTGANCFGSVYGVSNEPLMPSRDAGR